VAKLYRGMDVIFISDIRLNETDPKKFEQVVNENNEMNMRWVREMKPQTSLLKFRFPFDNISPRKFFRGDIHLQVYAPNTSAETRFVPSDTKLVNYDTHKYEEQLFYFNIKYRNASFLDMDEIYGINYDTYRVYLILETYLIQMNVSNASYNKKELKIEVAAMIKEIEAMLKKNIISSDLGWKF